MQFNEAIFSFTTMISTVLYLLSKEAKYTATPPNTGSVSELVLLQLARHTNALRHVNGLVACCRSRQQFAITTAPLHLKLDRQTNPTSGKLQKCTPLLVVQCGYVRPSPAERAEHREHSDQCRTTPLAWARKTQRAVLKARAHRSRSRTC